MRSHHKSGVDLIKVNATGGFMTARSMPWRAQFSDEEMTAIVEETHRLGKKVAAHAHGVEGIERAVAAGVDTIEHCTFVAEGGVVAPDLALIDEIAARGIHVCATATWNLPAMMRRNPDFRPPVRLMHERGVKLIAGNDSGIDGVPHADYVGGLETSVILGIPIEDVLVGATSRAAEALGLNGRRRRARPGRPRGYHRGPGRPAGRRVRSQRSPHGDGARPNLRPGRGPRGPDRPGVRRGAPSSARE